MHINTHIFVHTHIHTCMYMYVHINTHMYTYVHKYTHTHMYLLPSLGKWKKQNAIAERFFFPASNVCLE